MTYLELCVRVREEAGVSGNGPVSVSGQTSILSKIVNWVKKANMDILTKQSGRWLFLRKTKTVTLPAGQNEYSLASLDIAASEINAVQTSLGNCYKVVDYSDFLDMQSSNSMLGCISTLNNNGNLVLYPVPKEQLTITIDYFNEPKELKNNLDVPQIPPKFQEIIIARALMYYANYEEDNLLYQRANIEYEDWLTKLANSQLPKMK